MKAAVLHDPGFVTYETVVDPKLRSDSDAIIRVTTTALCGSDLHLYNGLVPGVGRTIPGHEFVGVVERVGPEVQRLKPGDRVVVPYAIACGQCWFCEHEYQSACGNSNAKRVGMFGYSDLHGGYDGALAEYVRVPFADYGPRRLPEHVSDEQALALSDILPTGWAALDWARLKGGETVAVFGSGPVGLMAQKSAWLQGAGRVFAIDLDESRLEMAERFAGSTTINISSQDAALILRDVTRGRGADVCVEAVGLSAVDPITRSRTAVAPERRPLELCLESVRHGGFISIVGAYAETYEDFPLGKIYDKEISLRSGPVSVHAYIDELLSLVAEGIIRADGIITHRFPLAEVAEAFALFNDHREHCVKVVLQP